MRLLLVGEHVLLLQGLATLLQGQYGAEIHTTVDSAEIDGALRRWSPDLVVAETSDVPGAGPLLVKLRQSVTSVPLVIIAPGDPAQFMASLSAGAKGFVGRDATAEQLFDCLASVERGEWSLPSSLVGHLVQEYLHLAAGKHGSLLASLTEREQRVLQLMVHGLSTQQIGGKLFLSESTVRTEIRSLVRKLGVENRMQAVTESVRLGLVTLD
jgi:two-component system NarL family response regulator